MRRSPPSPARAPTPTRTATTAPRPIRGGWGSSPGLPLRRSGPRPPVDRKRDELPFLPAVPAHGPQRRTTNGPVEGPAVRELAGATTSVGLDEDALPGAFLGRLDHGVELPVGNVGETVGPARLVEDLGPFLHIARPSSSRVNTSGAISCRARPPCRGPGRSTPSWRRLASQERWPDLTSRRYETQFNRPFPEKSQLGPRATEAHHSPGVSSANGPTSRGSKS